MRRTSVDHAPRLSHLGGIATRSSVWLAPHYLRPGEGAGLIFAALATSVGERLSDSPVAQRPRLSGLTHDRRGCHEQARIAPTSQEVELRRDAFEIDVMVVGLAPKGQAMAGAIDPLGHRKNALDAFLEQKVGEGFRIETHTDTHAIIVAGGRKSLLNWFRARGAGSRYVVSVDEHGVVTMVPAEPRRN